MEESLRDLVWQRANATCEYCKLPQDRDVLPLQIDHIIAQKHFGPTTPENLALCCLNCNLCKSCNVAGIDPVTHELTRLFHPRNDRWEDYFEWNGAVLSGKNAIGRVTIYVLDINHAQRVEHRQLLLMLGALGPSA